MEEKVYPIIVSEDVDIWDTFPLGGIEWRKGFTMAGIVVLHKIYGCGTITGEDRDGRYITVAFAGLERRFLYPDAFERFLRFEREDYQASMERFLLRRERESRYRRRNGLVYDPVEDEDYYKSIADELESLVKAEMAECRYMPGGCYRYWRVKQRILKEKYGITWHSPPELNPHVMFD